jgi:hypothetical protein
MYFAPPWVFLSHEGSNRDHGRWSAMVAGFKPGGWTRGGSARRFSLTTAAEQQLRCRNRAERHPNVGRKWGSAFRIPAAWLAVLAAACFLSLHADAADTTYTLGGMPHAGEVQQVQVSLDVEGKLSIAPPAGESRAAADLPMRVQVRLGYHEKALAVAPKDRVRARAARHYGEIQAEIRVGASQSAPDLSKDRRLIVAEDSSNRHTLFSPYGPLQPDELELIDVPASSLLLPALLPNRGVAIGETWRHEDGLVASLLGLDSVTQADLASTLKEVSGKVAKVQLAGQVSGAVGGVASQIDATGSYSVDLERGRILWIALTIKEKRSPGPAEPGFEVAARVRVFLGEAQEPAKLADKALAGLPLAAEPGTTLLDFRSRQGGFAILCDRRWNIVSDRKELSVLRRVEAGDMVGQCNVMRLDDLPAGKHTQLEEFQEEVRRALGASLVQFTEAAQLSTEAGLRVLRIEAIGAVMEVPVAWTYYLLSDNQGRRAALIFTTQDKSAERFAGADRALAGGFRFVDRPVDEDVPAPTPAAQRPGGNPSR